jgi:hypothetical protein
MNAVKHGLTARTVVLPHEDAEAYQQRYDAWQKDLNPGGDVAAYLVERAVRVSWQLDRADFHERARLAKRVSKRPRNKKNARERTAEDLIRRLLDPDDPSRINGVSAARKRTSALWPQTQQISEDPLELIRKLESSAEGCRRLVAEWGSLLESLDGWIGSDDKTCGMMIPRKRVLRLFGVHEEATEAPAELNPALLLLLRVQYLAEEEICVKLLRQGRDVEDDLEIKAAFPESKTEEPWPSTLVPDPATPPPDPSRLKTEFRTMVAEEYDRLSCRLKALEAEKADGEGAAIEQAERAAFDDSPEGDRLHRYQAHWSRLLLRTLDAIHREAGQDKHDRADRDEDVPVPCSSTASEPEAGPHPLPAAVPEVDVTVKAASESAPRSEEVNSAKRTHRKITRPLKAEPCGKSSKCARSCETAHKGVKTHERVQAGYHEPGYEEPPTTTRSEYQEPRIIPR